MTRLAPLGRCSVTLHHATLLLLTRSCADGTCRSLTRSLRCGLA